MLVQLNRCHHFDVSFPKILANVRMFQVGDRRLCQIAFGVGGLGAPGKLNVANPGELNWVAPTIDSNRDVSPIPSRACVSNEKLQVDHPVATPRDDMGIVILSVRQEIPF